MSSEADEPLPSAGSLAEVARVFLKVGTIGFGGPAAHVSMMRDEVVLRRQWVSEQEFLDALGATSVIPGPGSTPTALLALGAFLVMLKWRPNFAMLIAAGAVIGVVHALA